MQCPAPHRSASTFPTLPQRRHSRHSLLTHTLHTLTGFTLDFQGRVKEASVKNFQLVAWDHNTDRRGGDLLMQFGRADSDTYIVDFTYPLSIELAFAIALASIDTKLCYTV